jgi:hypothetical protein
LFHAGDPAHVKAGCEKYCMVWLAVLGASVVFACTLREGLSGTWNAPKCSMASALGGILLASGLCIDNERVADLGGIVILLAHACESTWHAWHHMRRKATSTTSPKSDVPPTDPSQILINDEESKKE